MDRVDELDPAGGDRETRWSRIVALLIVAIGLAVGVAPAGAAEGEARAAPTCQPPTPTLWGVYLDDVTVSAPPCSSGTGVTGYRVYVYEGTSSVASGFRDIGLGRNPAVFDDLPRAKRYRFRSAALGGSAAGPQSGVSAFAFPPHLSTRGYVYAQYEAFAGREPTAAELSRDQGRIDAGTLVPEQLVVDLLRAARHSRLQAQVIRLYQAYFLRLPDLSGLWYWEGEVSRGRSLTNVSSFFADSAEFRQRYGSLSNRAFVERVYLNVLGRAGEPSGTDFWTAELDAGRRSRGVVMVGFSESPEYVGATQGTVDVVAIYSGMLLLEADRDDIALWSGRPLTELVNNHLRTLRYGRDFEVAAPPSIVSGTLPRATRGAFYFEPVLALGGSAGSHLWSIVAGSLPAGLSISTSGWVSGTPTQAGSRTFTVQVLDTGAGTSTRQVTLTVDP